MNSKKTKKMVETMHDEAVARCERTAEGRPGGGDRRSEVGGWKSETTQVYLRFVGVRGDAAFESAQSGPWDVTVNGDLIVLDKNDYVELEREHKDLELYCQASGLKVQMAEVVGAGQLGEWRTVDVTLWQPVDGITGMIREALQTEVNRLHAERGETVLRAKASRLTWGLESDQFKMDWMQVEALTTKIAEAEKALESMPEEASRGDAEGAEMKVLRDPAVEMPDDETDVVIVLKGNDEGRGVTTGAHFTDHGWCETQDGIARGMIIRREMIAGWCNHDEAADALRKAVRHG